MQIQVDFDVHGFETTGQPNFTVELSGPLNLVQRALEAAKPGYYGPTRKCCWTRLYPIFILSHGRPDKCLANLDAHHALGKPTPSELPALVFLVVPDDQRDAYRSNWPSALILLLPNAALQAKAAAG